MLADQKLAFSATRLDYNRQMYVLTFAESRNKNQQANCSNPAVCVCNYLIPWMYFNAQKALHPS